VQAELSPLVLPLAPAAARAMPKSVPFMTAGEGVGRRTSVVEADSQLSGRIIVEDVTLQQDGADKVPLAGAAGRVMLLLLLLLHTSQIS
jgi:hypothetical protein